MQVLKIKRNDIEQTLFLAIILNLLTAELMNLTHRIGFLYPVALALIYAPFDPLRGSGSALRGTFVAMK